LADLGHTMPQAAQDVIGVSPDLERVAAEAQEAGAEALALATDVSRTADVDALVQCAVSHCGQVDILVCNVAILSDRKPSAPS
jgi:NAD(P)-dependent dehydrogenase (short-subunit alcohol dehydrogenase family)